MKSVPDTLSASITYQCKAADATGLPLDSQYSAIAKFEESVLDKLESQGLGLVTFVETHNGEVRYFLYVSDIDAVAELVNAREDQGYQLNVAADEDPQWEEYKKRMAKVSS